METWYALYLIPVFIQKDEIKTFTLGIQAHVFGGPRRALGRQQLNYRLLRAT